MSQPVDSRFAFGRFTRSAKEYKARQVYIAKLRADNIEQALRTPIVGTPIWKQPLPTKLRRK